MVYFGYFDYYFANDCLDKKFMLYEDGLWLSQGFYAKAYKFTNPLPWKLVNKNMSFGSRYDFILFMYVCIYYS